MSLWKWALIALGLVVVLVLAMLGLLGAFNDSPEKEVRHISVGERTISISHYKDMTQEIVAEGVKVVADGHVILATTESILVDGEPLEIDPDSDVEITIDEEGKLEARAVAPGTPTPPDSYED